jgi:hypothetical protein
MAMHHGERRAQNRVPWGEEEDFLLFEEEDFVFFEAIDGPKAHATKAETKTQGACD